jgi:2-polyprenyl-3-methyl-5-hydroxy-6-metoxy-1,4-benzoquinol methylase
MSPTEPDNPDNIASPSTSERDEEGSRYEHYETWKGWDQDNFAKLDNLSKATISAELRFLPTFPSEESTILEIGFGQGSFLAYAKNFSWRIIGVEINEKLIDVASKAGFVCKRPNDLDSIPEATFDLIVAFDVLEHIPNTEIIKFLSNIWHLLKPEGCLIARFPNGDSPFSLPLQNGDPTHLNHIGSGKIKFYAQTLNFELPYVGPSALPIRNVGPFRMAHRIITYPLKRLLNLLIRVIFFPTVQIEFISPNMTAVFKKPRQ